MCWTVATDFDADLRTPRRAREFVRANLQQVLAAAESDELTDDACLVLAELVTNAVQAGTSRIQVDVVLHHHELAIQVGDDCAGQPALHAPGPSEPHHRGLVIVQGLATHWGVRQLGDNQKQVWARLSVRTELTRSLVCSRLADQAGR